MKRRQLIQAMAVVPVVAALPAEAQGVQDAMSVRCAHLPGPMQVKLTVYPNEDTKFGPGLQDRIETWEEVYGEDFRPIETVLFDLLEADGSPWLVHPTWERYGGFLDNLAELYTKAHHIFTGRRWDLIDRAVDQRENAYWRQEHPPTAPWDSWGPFLGWREVVRARLARVVVRFDAEVRS